jgi:hypothetical protein
MTARADDQERINEVYERLNVDVMPDMLQILIAETIVRLPEDVAVFAIEQIRYRAFDPDWNGAMYLDLVLLPVFVRTENELVEVMEARASAPPRQRHWLVLLNTKLSADGAEPEAARGTIAHEIAHAWLGHSSHLPGSQPASSEEQERATDRLATQWGFARWPSWVDADSTEKT